MLNSSNQLGSSGGWDEFQIERTIVWMKKSNLKQTDTPFEDVWAAAPKVLLLAQLRSRVLNPDFWKAHDDADTSDMQLIVRGIWFDPVTGSATYEVGRNFGFVCENPIQLPELPDNHSIILTRDRGGNIAAAEP